MATPTSYLELSKTYQDQVLGLIEQSQKLAVESVSAWTKATTRGCSRRMKSRTCCAS